MKKMEDIFKQITESVFSEVVVVYGCMIIHLLSMFDLLQQAQVYGYMAAALC